MLYVPSGKKKKTNPRGRCWSFCSVVDGTQTLPRTCHCKHKQEETSSWSASQNTALNRLILHPDRNCSALNNLCLFAIFPCGSAQRPIIIYAHQTLPVSEGRPALPRRCASLYQRPRRNLAGGCGGFFAAVSGLPRSGSPKIQWKSNHLKPK